MRKSLLTVGLSGSLLALLIDGDRVEVLRAPNFRVEIPDVQHYEEVVFVPTVTSLEGTRFSYSFTLSVDANIRRPSSSVGDLDRNGAVNLADFVMFSQQFGQKPAAEGYDQRPDLNGDGRIDFRDFLIFASHFGE